MIFPNETHDIERANAFAGVICALVLAIAISGIAIALAWV
jgi:hypothetical protein